MESKDEILRQLEEFNSNVDENATIPDMLENYLRKIAKTGETMFPWDKLKALVIHKADQAMKEFDGFISMDTLPTYPNVENATFEQLRLRILKALKNFSGAPFTIQRIAELITEPRKHYKRTDKFLRGIEKNVNTVTTVDPFGIRLINDMLVVNGTDTNSQATPDRNTSLFLPPAPMNSPVTSSTVDTSTEIGFSTQSGDAPSMSLFKALTTATPTPTSGAATAPGDGEPTGSTQTSMGSSLFSPEVKASTEEEQGLNTQKTLQNGDSTSHQDTSRVESTSIKPDTEQKTVTSHTDINPVNTSPSVASTSKSVEGETVNTSSCYGSSSQSEIRSALPSDKVTVCVDTNEDEDVDVTNSDDDKMETSQEGTSEGVKREAAMTPATVEDDSHEPPVKRLKQDEVEVATSSQDIKRRESGGFETGPNIEEDAPSLPTQSEQEQPETATQHSDVSSSSINQEMESKDQTPSAATTSESDREAKPAATCVEAKDESSSTLDAAVTSDTVAEPSCVNDQAIMEESATNTLTSKVEGSEGSGNGQITQERTNCEPDSAKESSCETKEQDMEKLPQNEAVKAADTSSEGQEGPEPMDTD